MQVRQEWMNEVSDYFSHSHTPPNIETNILYCMNQWLDPLNTVKFSDNFDNPLLHNTLQQQSKIGWCHFIR
jgi:hypothetical protein